MAAQRGPHSSANVPSCLEIQTLTEEKLTLRPCVWQALSCQTLLQRRNLVSVSPTGSGKTLTFWMLFLYRPMSVKRVTILICPIQLLGNQHQQAAELQTLGIETINLTIETATAQAFKV